MYTEMEVKSGALTVPYCQPFELEKKMKKQIVKGIVVLLSLAFLAMPALSAVSVSPNEKGDLLIYPLYYALEGIETNFTVINTSATQCAVAKVIVRSHKYSIEVLGFFIYLTPNDVFKATLKYEGGKYILVSTDDSLLLGQTAVVAQASVEEPIALELYSPTYACDCATADSPDWGYIDVIEATAYTHPTASACAGNDDLLCCVQSDGSILKSDLFAIYKNDVGPFTPANILTGYAEMVFPGAEYALYKPTILKDYDNATKLQITERYPVFANRNDLEAALSKNDLVIPYFNRSDAFTIAWLTFPTKLTKCARDDDCAVWDSDSCYFEGLSSAKQIPTYSVSIYDMKEHERHVEGCVRSPCLSPPSNLPEEVNLIFDWLGSVNPFTEGWTRVVLEKTTDKENGTACETDSCDTIFYDDAPVIGLIAQITPEGLSLMSPAYDFGGITVGEATSADYSGCYQLGCVPCP